MERAGRERDRETVFGGGPQGDSRRGYPGNQVDIKRQCDRQRVKETGLKEGGDG